MVGSSSEVFMTCLWVLASAFDNRVATFWVSGILNEPHDGDDDDDDGSACVGVFN